MTPEDFIRQLDTAQSTFETKVSKLAMWAADHEDQAPYLPGIARCVATLNVLASAQGHDWEKAALDSSKKGFDAFEKLKEQHVLESGKGQAPRKEASS